MANFLKGEAPLKLSDGREFVLVLDFNAMVEVESITGKPAPEVLGDLNRGFLGAMRAVVFGALRQRHPSITATEVTEILVSDGPAVHAAIAQAVDQALPPATEDKQPGKAGGSHGTTSASGSNGAKRGSTRKPSGKRPRATSR